MYAATVQGSWPRELYVWTGSGKGRRIRCRNDNMHTQFHDERQFGPKIWAAAKPERKIKDASGGTRSDIWRLVALWVTGLKRTGEALKTIDGLIR